MDGNGRWADSRGLPVEAGHREGTRALRRTVEAAIDLGVRSLVVYVFSTENWSRPDAEIADLMEILSETIDRELPDLAKQGVRTRFLGRRDRVDPWLEEKMRGLEERTAHLDTLQLWIAFDYGGRAELVHAARQLVEDGVGAGDVDESAVGARLYAPDLGDVDLLVRTSGELRLSNFLLWEAAYAELVFTDTLWPDFDADDLRAAVDEYAIRTPPLRRTGPRVSPFVSRVLVTLILLPLVLGIVWLGGWWLFALALVGGLLALHELYGIARGLHPMVLGGYAGLVLTLLGAQLGGLSWLLAGILSTLPIALVAFFVSSVRQNAVAAFATTLLGVAWVGGGLAHLLLVRDIPDDGRLLIFTVLLTVFADDTAAFFVGRTIGRHRLAPAISPGKSSRGSLRAPSSASP